jgi:hypothetical protein
MAAKKTTGKSKGLKKAKPLGYVKPLSRASKDNQNFLVIKN